MFEKKIIVYIIILIIIMLLLSIVKHILITNNQSNIKFAGKIANKNYLLLLLFNY